MSLFRNGTAHVINGVPGRLIVAGDVGAPVWIAQKWVSESRPVKGYGTGAQMRFKIRFDDECHNGYNTFAITAEVRVPGRRDIEAGGCMHEEMAQVFPELASLIPWHLVSSDGPLHYIANTVYFSGVRDYDAARHAAIWPEATGAELSVDKAELTAALERRHPALMARFRAAMEGAGLAWAPPTTAAG